MLVPIDKERIKSESTLTNSPFDKLPNEIFLYLFSFFDANTLASCSIVAKRWQLFSKDNSLYLRLFLEIFPDTAKGYLKENINQKLFTDSLKAKNRIYSSNFSQTLKTIPLGSLTDVKIAYGKIYGLINSRLQALDLKCLNISMPFRSPNDTISFFKIFNKKIYAAHNLQHMKVYDAENGEILNSIRLNQKQYVIDLDVAQKKIYALVSNEQSIRVFSEESGKEIKEIGTSHFFDCIKIVGPFLFCRFPGGLQILDEQGREIRKHQNQNDQLITFEVSKEKIYASFTRDNQCTYLIWDISTGKELSRHEDTSLYATSIKIFDNLLLVGWSDNSIEIYDESTGKLLRKLTGSMDTNQLVMHDSIIYNPEESKINYWDFKHNFTPSF